MSVRTFLLRSLLAGCALLLAVALGEWWLRSRLFGDDPAYATWRDPRLYSWSYRVDQRVVHRGDDHDKLAIRWGMIKPLTDHPHALLGWSGDLDSATLMPKGFAPGATDRPVVLLGAGWAEHQLVAGTDSGVIDLGVPGFSFDQDLLLFDSTRRHYRGGQVMLLIDLDRLDHLQRAFVARPKPWFTLGAYAGDLHGVPVTTDINAYLEAAPADPGLYSYHLFRSLVLNDTAMSGSAVNAAEKELEELSKKLLFVLLHRAQQDSTTISVHFEQNCGGTIADRQRWALQDVCTKMGVQYHVLAEEAEAIGRKDQVGMARAFLRNALTVEGPTGITSLSRLHALAEAPQDQQTPLERNMVTILKDPKWLAAARRKAGAAGVPLAVMVQRDARYILDHAQQ
jgi:hypothetical protein